MTTTKSGRQRWLKMALIPVLGMVLFAVVWSNQKGDSAESDTELTDPALLKKQPFPTAFVAPATIEWPTVDLAKLIATNPFKPLIAKTEVVEEPPVEAPPAEATADASAAEPTQEAALPDEPPQIRPVTLPKIDFIYESGGERIAVADSQRIRIGDMIEHGRVIEITDTEVIIEHVANDESVQGQRVPQSSESMTGSE